MKITLVDGNDNPPIFDQSTYRVFIDEGAVKFEPDLYVSARDKDKSSVVKYSIISGNEYDLFAIDPNSGKLRISGKKGLDVSNELHVNDNIILTIEVCVKLFHLIIIFRYNHFSL